MQQRAFQQSGLRRHLAIGENLQRPAYHRHRLSDRRAGGSCRHRPTLPRRRLPDPRQILVGDELVAVALEHHARERPAADHEHLLVVLLEFIDQRQEIAVAADDDEGVDVGMSERHFEGVECEIDVGAVLVAARRHVALHQANRVLGERAAVFAGSGPVGVGDLGDDFATFLDRVEDDSDIELLAQRVLDANLDVVEVDENGDVQTILMRQSES